SNVKRQAWPDRGRLRFTFYVSRFTPYSGARMTPLSGEALDAKLREFLAEDVGSGDVTTEWTVPVQTRARGRLVARSACVVSGLSVARRTLELLDSDVSWEERVLAGVPVP